MSALVARLDVENVLTSIGVSQRAEEERNNLQRKIDEASTSGMKAHLMNTKIEEIISSVVEPERLRALQETDGERLACLCAGHLWMRWALDIWQLPCMSMLCSYC